MATDEAAAVCMLCGDTAGVRVYDDDGTTLCPAHVPPVFAATARRHKDLLAQTAALRDQLARVAEALYDEVRHPINAKGGAWTDEEIRYYLSDKWGLTIPPEVEAARLARVGLTWAELAARTPTPGAVDGGVRP